MTKKSGRVLAFLLTVVLITVMLPTFALANGKIETDRPVAVTLIYDNEGTAITDAVFEFYKVADVDPYSKMTLTDTFAAYKNSVEELSNLKDMNQEGWMSLAATLNGYVQRDNLTPEKSGHTDADGTLVFDDLEVGLYLILGYQITTPDFKTYVSLPFMVFLPGNDAGNNVWDYNVTVLPKFTVDEEVLDGKFVTRKALKVWDDKGFETVRPKEITVQLLMDGEVYDTQILNKENSWRCAWDNLDAKHEWLVVEKEEEGYFVTVERSGITFVITNKYLAPVSENQLTVQKRITGDTPKQASEFTFVLKSESPDCPMPGGTFGTEAQVSVSGAGTADFGKITFDTPGTYSYTVTEKAGNEKGYTYDKTVYTVTFEVVQKEGEFTVTKTVKDDKGNIADNVVFTNPYEEPGNELPQTGVLWWPVPVLFCLGIVFLAIGITLHRRKNN